MTKSHESEIINHERLIPQARVGVERKDEDIMTSYLLSNSQVKPSTNSFLQ